jgi:hypothetical protein
MRSKESKYRQAARWIENLINDKHHKEEITIICREFEIKTKARILMNGRRTKNAQR